MRSLMSGLLLAVFTVACGQPGEQALGPEHAGVAGEALATTSSEAMGFYKFEFFGNAGSDGAPLTQATYSPPNQFARALDVPMPQATGHECYAITGSELDSDGDGIPDFIRVEHDCTGVEGDTTYHLTGALFIEDTAPAVPDPWRFTAGQDALTITVSAPDYDAQIIEDWVVAAERDANEFAIAHQASVDVTQITSQQSNRFLVSHSISTRLDGSTNRVQFEGAWSVRAQHNDNIGRADATLIGDVTYDATCPENIVDGFVAATYDGPDGSAEVRVIWTGCGIHRIEFNGASV